MENNDGIIRTATDLYKPPTGYTTANEVESVDLFEDLLFDDFFSETAEKAEFWKSVSSSQQESSPVPEAVNLAATKKPPAVPKQVPVLKESHSEPEPKKAKVADGLNDGNKLTRIRAKFKVESLAQRVAELEKENEQLRKSLAQGEGGADTTPPPQQGSLEVSADDFSMMECLLKAKSNFCITDPHKPDNPIVKCSDGFYQMTGYSPEDVIGKNCRFLQGPGTKPETVQKVRHAMEKGEAVAVTMLNYRKDGSYFWNQVYISPLMGPDGKSIVHYIGVQREVKVKNLPNAAD